MADLTMVNAIIEKIQLARNELISNEQFYKNPNKLQGKNEFLFFIKPEITRQSDTIKLDKVIELILNKIAEFKLSVENVSLIPAQYLKNFNIIDRHYGVINKLSKDIHNSMSEDGKSKFERVYGKKLKDAEIYGSLEFLKVFNEFTPLTLDYLWQQQEFTKLAGGTYCQRLNFNGREVYLIDGFHPRQLKHYTKPGRSIVTMTLIGDLSWSDARNNFIGATNPEIAVEGSLRSELLANQDKFGLPPMSASWNGVHLSAGPVEALAELIRYNSDLAHGQKQSVHDYQFGKKLVAHFGDALSRKIIKNIDVIYRSKRETVFDLTEEMDSDEAIEVLQKVDFL